MSVGKKMEDHMEQGTFSKFLEGLLAMGVACAVIFGDTEALCQKWFSDFDVYTEVAFALRVAALYWVGKVIFALLVAVVAWGRPIMAELTHKEEESRHLRSVSRLRKLVVSITPWGRAL